MKGIFTLSLMFLICFRVCPAIFYPDNVPLYAIWQKSVENTNNYSNKFNFKEIELKGTFTGPSGKAIEFFGYYNGDGKGGQTGSQWEIRFMPTEPGTWQYALSFTDGTAIPNGSGTFTVIGSDLPGPPALDPQDSRFLVDARGNPIKWKGYDMHSVHRPYNTGMGTYWEGKPFVMNVINNHLLGQGYNATMLGGPGGDELFVNPSDLTKFQLRTLEVFDDILEALAENRVYAVNWNSIVWQNVNNGWSNLNTHYQLVYRYYVARYAPFYNYFGWSPTWETWELSSETDRVEKFNEYLNSICPWEKFPTTHDRAKSEWSDWQRIQLRQNQSRTVIAGNNRTADGFSGYRYVIFGAEDCWEYSSGAFGQPRNGTEVRRGIWGQLFAGVYTLYYEWYHGGTSSGPAGGPGNGEGDAFNKIAMDFWYDNTSWYKYQMKNSLVSDGSNCRASGWTDNEYVVYDQNGGGNAINLSEANGTFMLTWLNPLTGATVDGGSVTATSSVTLNPPGSMSGEWCAFISRNDGPVNKSEHPNRDVSRSFIKISPNPFYQHVRIKISAPNKTQGGKPDEGMILGVYDIHGSMIANLTSKVRSGQAVWHAKGRASTIFIVKCTIGEYQIAKKIFIMK